MALKYKTNFLAENRIPDWLHTALEIASVEHGKDIHLDLYSGLNSFSLAEDLTVLLPGRYHVPGYSKVFIGNGERQFNLTKSRVMETLPLNAIPLDTKWRVLPYTTHKGVPLFFIHDGALVINATFGDTYIYEYTKSLARQTAKQPLDPGSVIFSDITQVITTFLERRKEDNSEKQAASWARFRVADIEATIKKKNKLLAANAGEIAAHQDSIRRILGAIQDINRYLTGITTERAEDGVYQKEFVKIAKNLLGRYYTDIQFGENRMVLSTVPITIVDNDNPDKRWLLGRYKVDVIMSSGEFLVYSLDGISIGGKPHPHVDAANIPCLGTVSTTLPTLFKHGDILEGLEILYKWITGYTPKDAYYQMRDNPGLGYVPVVARVQEVRL